MRVLKKELMKSSLSPLKVASIFMNSSPKFKLNKFHKIAYISSSLLQD